MKQYNYEARNEDKQNNYPKVAQPEDSNVKTIPVYEQLAELEYAIEKLTELQKNLINRLMWVSIPCDRPSCPEICGETKGKSERPDSEIVQRIKRSVQNIRELQFNLSIQLEDLDV
jgi:hypothetical protein